MKKWINIQLASTDQCTGCAACASVCPTNSITMREDNEGFLQPHIDAETCVNCHKCEKTCPIITPIEISTDFETQVYAAINKDEEVRMKSSSGGMFHALAKWTIEQGGVVFGAGFEGIHLKQQYVESLDELAILMGSKYIQSDVADSYKQAKTFLKEDRWVLYSGTPCQIAGLKRFLGKDYEKLVTVDLICRGVPSPRIFESYIKRLQTKIQAQDIKNISFRYNIDYYFNLSYKDKNGFWRQYKDACNKNPYFSYFLRCIFRASCYQCQYRSIDASYADFTIGDCWTAEKNHPQIADGKGVSSVVIHTEKAGTLFEDLKGTLKWDAENISNIKERYESHVSRATNEGETRNWRLANRLAQYLPLEYMRGIYMHDRFILRVQRKLRKLIIKK